MGSRDQTQIIRLTWQMPFLLNHLTSLVRFFSLLFSQVGAFPQTLTSLVFFCLTLVPTLTGILGGLFVKSVCTYICVPLVEAGGQFWMSSSGMPLMSFETNLSLVWSSAESRTNYPCILAPELGLPSYFAMSGFYEVLEIF